MGRDKQQCPEPFTKLRAEITNFVEMITLGHNHSLFVLACLRLLEVLAPRVRKAPLMGGRALILVGNHSPTIRNFSTKSAAYVLRFTQHRIKKELTG